MNAYEAVVELGRRSWHPYIDDDGGLCVYAPLKVHDKIDEEFGMLYDGILAVLQEFQVTEHGVLQAVAIAEKFVS